MGDPLVTEGDVLACDIDQDKVEKYGQVKFECDIQGSGAEGEWVEEEDIPVSDLKLNDDAIIAARTGQATRFHDRDIEFTLKGSTCGFGMSGWGGILECSR